MEENKKTSMERLTEASKAFNERMKKDLEESERFKLMERYSNFLSQLEVNGEEENKILTKEKRLFYYQVYLWFKKFNFKMKDRSTKWNPALVGKTFEFINDWNRIKKKSPTELYSQLMEQNSSLKLRMGKILIEINDEVDFATKAFCVYQFQYNDVIDWSFVPE